jgi:adenylate cyclase class IV
LNSMSFKEIEHKYIVGPEFNSEDFFQRVRKLIPIRTSKINVKDTYYVLNAHPRHIFRHRFDSEIQQLTIKSVEADAAIRTEINLPIDQSRGDQKLAVEAFMKALGCTWSGQIQKQIDVAYFEDCEIVFYRAVGQSAEIYCVEFEAINPASINAGLAILEKYESALGFATRHRESKSLFELTLLSEAPANVKELFLRQ